MNNSVAFAGFAPTSLTTRIVDAGSVREAIAGIEATPPQAVTLDISLPDGSGIEMLKHIHKRGWKVFVLVLTGDLYEALPAKGQQLGAAAVLDKLDGLAHAAEALLADRPNPKRVRK